MGKKKGKGKGKGKDNEAAETKSEAPVALQPVVQVPPPTSSSSPQLTPTAEKSTADVSKAAAKSVAQASTSQKKKTAHPAVSEVQGAPVAQASTSQQKKTAYPAVSKVQGAPVSQPVSIAEPPQQNVGKREGFGRGRGVPPQKGGREQLERQPGSPPGFQPLSQDVRQTPGRSVTPQVEAKQPQKSEVSSVPTTSAWGKSKNVAAPAAPQSVVQKGLPAAVKGPQPVVQKGPPAAVKGPQPVVQKGPPALAAPQPVVQKGPPAAVKGPKPAVKQIVQGVADIGIQQPRRPSTQPAQTVQSTNGILIPSRMDRRKGGEMGRHTTVEVNFLPLCVKSTKAIHYDVTFTPDRPKALLRVALNKVMADYFPGRYPAFDGSKNMYTSTKLFDSAHFESQVTIINQENAQEKTFNVSIKFASHIDLTSLNSYMNNGSSLQIPQEALQCLDIAIRTILTTSKKFVQVGRSFFTNPGRVLNLGDGMQLWHGVFTSAVLGWKPYLNIDVAHKGFPTPQLVTEYLYNAHEVNLENGYIPDYKLKECSKFLKGLRVQYVIPNQPQSKRSYKINDIKRESSKMLEFTTENGVKMTVENYYKKMKGYFIKYPNLPCLWVGNTAKRIYVPVELCTILPGQVVLKKLTENQTRAMIKESATSTSVRKNKIMDALEKSGLDKSQPGLNEFGLEISNQFARVKARVLNPPPLQYKNIIEVPKQGVWSIGNGKFFRGASIRNWTVLSCADHMRQNDIEKCSDIIRRAGFLGMDVSNAVFIPPTSLSLRNRTFKQDLARYFDDAKNKKKIELMFVILPNSGDAYGKIKQQAELKQWSTGILTQCLKMTTVCHKLNQSTIDNILLKVNAKLNGINHRISPKRPFVLNTPVMIVGADVTHPSPEQTDIPSVVGVAASHDPTGFKYNMCWRLQLPKVEIIEDLKNIMISHLRLFYEKTNYQPEKILFFRDGVSEGQFKYVLNSELMAIRAACSSLNENYKPKITMIIVQKRHHTRFFPTDPRNSVGKNQNVEPGTVVDTEITHPTELNFYLVSHQSIQGVARPTKYHRLWDDSNMSEDDLEELTYYLCHMFSRCTRAVSYPAPTYYAHLAAYRGRVYLEGQEIKISNLSNEQAKNQIHDNIQKDQPMFFV